MNGLFRDRAEAGKVLAPLLRAYAHRTDVIVLALPRGGVPVAAEVARKLHAPVDIVMVKKLSVPGRERIPIGAVASDGVEIRDRSTIAAFQVPRDRVEAMTRTERATLQHREKEYRQSSPFPNLEGKTVILVDDAIVSGATMSAALRFVQLKHPACIVLAAPVASENAIAFLKPQVSAVVTVLTNGQPFSVADYYRDAHSPSDAEISSHLKRSGCALAGSAMAA